MKKNYTSEEAFYNRMRKLAEVDNKTTLNESESRSLGTLINYEKASDGVIYGIIKENHNYYIKKAGIQDNPDISDFAYIGGEANITEFQYKSLGEADKVRNMLFNTIAEGHNPKAIEKKPKRKSILTEGAEEEIEKAEDKIEDLDAKTDDAKASAEVEFAPPADMMNDIEPEAEETAELDVDINADDDTPAEEVPEEPEADGEETEELDADDLDVDDPNKEIEKLIGKVTEKIRKLPEEEISASQTKAFINSFLSAFKDLLPEVEVEDRKEMANKILKVDVSGDDVDDLGVDVEDEIEAEKAEEIGENEKSCTECGSFAEYAESRGYNDESIFDCDEEEMANVISGYATAYGDGENEGDKEVVAKFISLMPQVLDILKSEYGHDEYADELESMVDPEADGEEIKTEINELFAGLKHLGQKAVQGVGGAIKKGAEKVGQAATAVKQSYYAGEKNAALKKAEQMANELGSQIEKINKKAQKAGEEPIKTSTIMQIITNNLARGGKANLGKLRTAEEVEEQDDISGNIQVDEQNEEIQLDEKFINMVDLIKNAKNLTGDDKVKYDELQKRLNADGDLGMNDMKELQQLLIGAKPQTEVAETNISEQKVRKYIRNRIEEKLNNKKPLITEEKKSDKLKQLDKLIDEQLKDIVKK